MLRRRRARGNARLTVDARSSAFTSPTTDVSHIDGSPRTEISCRNDGEESCSVVRARVCSRPAARMPTDAKGVSAGPFLSRRDVAGINPLAATAPPSCGHSAVMARVRAMLFSHQHAAAESDQTSSRVNCRSRQCERALMARPRCALISPRSSGRPLADRGFWERRLCAWRVLGCRDRAGSRCARSEDLARARACDHPGTFILPVLSSRRIVLSRRALSPRNCKLRRRSHGLASLSTGLAQLSSLYLIGRDT